MSGKRKIHIQAGKVPASVKAIEIEVNEGEVLNVEKAMNIAAQQCGFSFTTKEYQEGTVTKMDVPYLNGKPLAEMQGDKVLKTYWTEPVSDGDIILIIPKIKGNIHLRS